MARKHKPRRKTLAQQAGSQVDLALSPILEAIRAQQTDARNRALSNAQAAQAAYGAAAKLQGSVAPDISSTYSAAADRQATFAKGYSDTMQQLQNKSADQGNAILAQNGSPQTVTAGQGASDVLYGLGGALPAETLNQQGAAFTAAARFLPETTRGLGLEQFKGEIAKGEDTAKGFDQQILDLEAKRPGLIQDALNELRQARAQQQEYMLKQQVASAEFGLNTRKQSFYEAKTKTQLRLEAAGLRFKNKQALQKAKAAIADGAKPDPSLSKVYGYVVDENGHAILGPDHKKIGVVQNSSKGAGGVTNSQKSTILARGNSAGEHALEGVTDRIWANTPFSDVDPSNFKQGTKEYDAAVRQANQAKKTYRARLAKNYGTAMAAVIQAIGPHLRAAGYTQAQIRAEAKRIVSAQIAR